MIPVLGGPVAPLGEFPADDRDELVAHIAEYWRKRRDEMLLEWTRAALDRGDLGGDR